MLCQVNVQNISDPWFVAKNQCHISFQRVFYFSWFTERQVFSKVKCMVWKNFFGKKKKRRSEKTLV